MPTINQIQPGFQVDLIEPFNTLRQFIVVKVNKNNNTIDVYSEHTEPHTYTTVNVSNILQAFDRSGKLVKGGRKRTNKRRKSKRHSMRKKRHTGRRRK